MKAHAIAAGAAVLLASVPAFAGPTTITYNDFSNTTGLSLASGCATVATPSSTTPQGCAETVANGVLNLTPQAQFQAGAALTSAALALGPTPSFSTSFNFDFATTPGVSSANGFAFVLTSNPAGVGTSNGSLGLTTATSLAVEFSDYGNSHLNPAIGNGLYNSNLVAAIQNGNTVVAGNPTGSYGSPGGTTNCSTTGVNCLNNGTVWTANISYANGLLNVVLVDGANVFNVITNYAIALAGNVYAGFSGSTGGAYQTAQINSWTLTYNNVPEPMTAGLFGVGLAALGVIRSRRRAV